MVDQGRFRRDLFYRINVVNIVVPPLRERKEDIPLLIEYFINRYSEMYNRNSVKLSARLMEQFLEYSWPGNVREVENNVKRFVILGNESQLLAEFERKRRNGTLSALPMPEALDEGRQEPRSARPASVPMGNGEKEGSITEKATLKEVAKLAQRNAERELIERVLRQTRWNRRKASQIPGVRTESGIGLEAGELLLIQTNTGASGGRMAKAKWAVACSTTVAVLLTMIVGGCNAAPLQIKASAPVTTTAATSSASIEGSGAALPPAEAGVVLSGPAYRIGPEDVLRVSVWGNNELTLDVTVRPDGKISIPLIKDVQAEGLTATELSDFIHFKLLEFVKDPQVSVIVKEVNAQKIFVIGNVAKQGPIPLRGDMSLLQALSLAGGFNDFASPKKIKIIRAVSPGRQEVRTVNYFEIIENAGAGNYLLRPGDTIVVP